MTASERLKRIREQKNTPSNSAPAPTNTAQSRLNRIREQENVQKAKPGMAVNLYRSQEPSSTLGKYGPQSPYKALPLETQPELKFDPNYTHDDYIRDQAFTSGYSAGKNGVYKPSASFDGTPIPASEEETTAYHSAQSRMKMYENNPEQKRYRDTEQALKDIDAQIVELSAKRGEPAENYSVYDEIDRQVAELNEKRKQLMDQYHAMGGKHGFYDLLQSAGDVIENVARGNFPANLDKFGFNVEDIIRSNLGLWGSEQERQAAYDRAHAAENAQAEELQQIMSGHTPAEQAILGAVQAGTNMWDATAMMYASGLPQAASQYLIPALQPYASMMPAPERLGTTAVGNAMGNASATLGRAGAKAAIDLLANPTNTAISLSSALSTWDDARSAGASETQAFAVAFLTGAAEYLSNKMFSGTPLEDAPGEQGYVTQLINKFARKIGKEDQFGKIFGNPIVNFVFDKSGEGWEEVITGVLDPWIARLTYDPDRDVATLDELWDEYVGGVLLSLLMAPGEYAGQAASAIKANAEQKKSARRFAGIAEVMDAAMNGATYEDAIKSAGRNIRGVDKETLRSNYEYGTRYTEVANKKVNNFRTLARATLGEGLDQGAEVYRQVANEIDPDDYFNAVSEAYQQGIDGEELTAQSETVPDRHMQAWYEVGREVANQNAEAAQAEEVQNGQSADEGAERNDGLGAERETRGLDEGAVESGDAAEDGSRQAYVQRIAQTFEKVSSAEAGLSNGTNAKTLRLFGEKPDANWPAEMKTVYEMGREAGVAVRFYSGRMVLDDGNGYYTVRGLNEGGGKDTIWIRADAAEDIIKIARHELFHQAERRDPGLRDRIRDQIVANHNEEQLRAVISKYADALVGANLTDDQLLSEIFADAYGGIDIFEGITGIKERATDFAGVVEQKVSEAPTQRTQADQIAENLASRDQSEQRTLEKYDATVVDGVVVSNQIAEIMRSPDYHKPVSVSDLADMASHDTLPDWKKKYLQPDEEGRVGSREAVRAIQRFDDLIWKSIAGQFTDTQQLLQSFVPTGKINAGTYGPLRTNIEYRRSFDMDTTCPRTFQFVSYRNEIQKRLGRTLTFNESINLINLMAAYKQMIPCTYCYVENKRILKASYYNEFYKYHHAVMEGVAQGVAVEDLRPRMYGYDAKKKKLTDAAEKVLQEWMESDSGYNPTVEENYHTVNVIRNAAMHLLDAKAEDGTISAETSVDNLAKVIAQEYGIESKEAMSEVTKMAEDWKYDASRNADHIYLVEDTEEEFDHSIADRALALDNAAVSYANSASSAKSVDNYVPYGGQLSAIDKATRDYIIGMGGIRKHSSNDFRIDYVLDYFQFFADLAKGEWTGHTYTKNADYVRIFGRTGDMINMSIAFTDTKNGVVENASEGMEHSVARELREAYANAGIMAMVTSDKQLSFALNADWVDMIIPFHNSGLPSAIWYNMKAWTDYTSVQSETFYNTKEMKDALKSRGVSTNGMKAAQVRDLFNSEFGIKAVEKLEDKDKKNIGKRFAPHFFPYETTQFGVKIPGHGNSKARYLELCREYGVHPRFDGVKVKDADGNTINVIDHPNYMKLVKEAAAAKEGDVQKPIQFSFNKPDPYLTAKYGQQLGKTSVTPMDYAMDRLVQEAKNGGYSNAARDDLRIVDEFMQEYAGKGRTIGWTSEHTDDMVEALDNAQFKEQIEYRKQVLAEFEQSMPKGRKKRAKERSNFYTNMASRDLGEDSASMASREITPQQDADYLAAVERGGMETAQRMVDEAAEIALVDSKARTPDGKLMRVRHGTNAEFTVFDPRGHGGETGKAEGFGIYVTDSPEVSKNYGARQLDGYAYTKRPAYANKKTIRKPELVRLIKAAAEYQAKQMVETDDYGSVQEALPDSWISNYANTYEMSLQDAYASVADQVLRYSENDADIVREVMGGMAIREYDAAMDFYRDVLTPTTGIDSLWTVWKNAQGDDANVLVLFDSSQFKSADPVTYDDNGNVIPLSERFNTEEQDIRYSREIGTDYLRQQNEDLHARVDEVREKSDTSWRSYQNAEKMARALRRTFSSTVDIETVKPMMRMLIDKLADKNTDYAEAKQLAVDIARLAIQNSQVMTEETRAYTEAKAYLRKANIFVPEAVRNAIENFDEFAKAHPYLRPRKTIGFGIGDVYTQLQKRMGTDYFPTDIRNDAEKLTRIADVMDNVTPVYENPYSVMDAELYETGANILLDAILDNRAAQMLDSAERFGQRMKERADAKADKIEQLKQDYKTMNEERRKRKNDSAERQKLLNVARRLKNRKMNAVNRATVDYLIGDLDTVAVSMTGKSLGKLVELQAYYDSLADDPNFISDPAIEKKLKRLSQRQISSMTLDEVRDLTEVLLAIEKAISTRNKLIRSEDRRNIAEQSEETQENIRNTRGVAKKTLADWIATNTLTPERLVRRLTGYVDTDPLYMRMKELSDGQRKKMAYQMRAQKMFLQWTDDDKFIDQIRNKGTIKITGYVDNKLTEAEITPDMRMALYLHSLNDDNLRHIMYGGITIPNIDLYRKGDIAEAYSRGVTMKLSPEMIRNIAQGMTAREKAFAQAAHKYFNGMSRDAINETSEALKGYSIATEDNYFPIQTDAAFTATDIDALKFDGTLEGMGFLTERVHARNAIYLVPMVDVLNKSIRNHAKYYGLAIPVANINKLWKATVASEETDSTHGLKDTMRSKWGSRANDAITQIIADVQNPSNQSDDLSKLLSQIRSNYAGAVLTLNASVAMKQAASYPTAAAVLGWGPVLKAMKQFGSVDLDLIAKYTPLQWYRSLGYSTQELGDIAKRGGLMDKLMKATVNVKGKEIPILNWIQGIDLATTRKLWKASEIYVQENNKDLKIGTDEYYKAVAEIYNRVIEETQPNYTTMQRPQILRTQNQLLQTMVMFKTQPFQNFNILYDALGELRAAETMAKNGDSSKLAGAKKNAVNAVTSNLVSAVVFAAMTMAWNLIRHKREKYEDKEGNFSPFAQMAKDIVSSEFGMVPFGSDAYNAAVALFGEKYYGMSNITSDSISGAVESFINAGKALNDMAKSLLDGDDATNADPEAMARKLFTLAQNASKTFGIPLDNVVNLITAVYSNVASAVDGEYVTSYYVLRLTKGVSSSYNKAAAYDILYKAKGTSQYDEIRSLMLDDGFKESNIDAAMKKRDEK